MMGRQHISCDNTIHVSIPIHTGLGGLNERNHDSIHTCSGITAFIMSSRWRKLTKGKTSGLFGVVGAEPRSIRAGFSI